MAKFKESTSQYRALVHCILLCVLFLKQHIPTLNGEIPEQKQDLPRPSSLITTKDEFFKMPMYKDIDSYILQVTSIVSSDS